MIRSLVLASIALAAMTSSALAHFKLMAPQTTLVQGEPYGDPQKAGPCGGSGTATNAVTNYTPGQMITITVDETIDHPGHYRIALAQDEGSLPAPPPVTAGGTACGSAPIQSTPALPVLADGLFVDLTAAQGATSAQVQLPAGMTCNNCVMQVLEFMSNHGAPCFYYHCAKVNISATAPDAGPPGPDAGGNGGPDAGNGNNGSTGGCSTSGGAGPVLGLALLGLVIRRRRRR